ncbi:hypothetical protein GGTG_09263 [Gaeumannomyces tritici R3-111a-1]|uniref:Uncharacterized protein n=1 Tax=Gaeumannomyces tritici (strain R3-111a-1) TaxID=644352 RepID=J3P6X0_GAET3|nr:hypothetical protein GGTG_09263 [Gaeumannomyces tritici R3-111a-1]EJT72397.1 hypothetical protein GGTG_09263 [Gaeumannomyces tritici R3-111a-1]
MPGLLGCSAASGECGQGRVWDGRCRWDERARSARWNRRPTTPGLLPQAGLEKAEVDVLPHTTSLDRTRPGATRASPSTRGPRDALTPASGSGSGANKTVPTDTARAALGRQKSGDDRVQKRPATAAAAAATQVNSSTPSAASIAGVYEVMSDALRAGWPDVTGDMWLRVAPARDAAGVYVASFDFGVLKGLMLIGTDRDAIRACSRALDGGPPGRRCRRGGGAGGAYTRARTCSCVGADGRRRRKV